MKISKFDEFDKLLLEKRIGQILSKIEIIFNFEVIKTIHSHKRETRTDVEDYNTKIISNGELLEFINYFKKEIAEHIATNEIVDGVEFITKSDSRELCCVIIPQQESFVHWKLILKTVWRESSTNRFRVGEGQLVIIKP